MIRLILLAAGLSERFGSSKALAEIKGQPIIKRLQKMILKTLVDETVIVLGARQELLVPHVFKHKKITSVYNKHYKFGQTSSIQTALKILSADTKGFFILPVDFPMVASSTIQALIDEFNKNPDGIIIPAFEGRRGHPPLFSAKFKDQILSLPRSLGLNTAIHENALRLRTLEVNDAGVRKTFNTPEEFQKIVKEK